MAILEVRNLTHTYSGNTPFINDAVSDVSFKINKGEIIGIIGHTGSGKSTLVQHLNGLLQPTKGSVFIENENIWKNPKEIRKIRSKVGLVFQYPEYQLFEETVFKDIAFGPSNMGISGEELTKTVLETCKIVGVKPEFLEKSPFDLSGGEKRRVAIAGVISMEPKVLILDEPTAGLDPLGKNNLLKLIKDYNEQTGNTVIFVSHNMDDVALVADRVIVMNDGEVALDGTVDEVYSQGEKLASLGLDVPEITSVFIELNNAGFDWSYRIYGRGR